MIPGKKSRFHIRNKHQGHYDFKKLIQSCPELKPFVLRAPSGLESISFSDPRAVRTLNRALLLSYYPLQSWEFPESYLCPPIPGRADTIHHIADLLAGANGGQIPTGSQVRVLDVGVGSSCIYPILGFYEYGWKFVGTECDRGAADSAKRIIDANPELTNAIEIRLQPNSDQIFAGIVQSGEKFDVAICNPPFHASQEEAQAGSDRKWRNLGKNAAGPREQLTGLNFGGQGNELWCLGGEVGFIRRMISESMSFKNQFKWFTTLVSKESSLEKLYENLRKAQVSDVRTLDMAQGQKKSRLLAWTFHS